ncbi:hypothetical protein BU14_1084s0001 [Porphyra umbilicalis]|uniref:Uncharacterized protein n=1 Tax=Porphyra umbilicalis TaxID=2786 RepID=A0A1X6NN96_PORUM|nr:hypothetical protein BU14_1084s0001 [Porphyra umbilicalis]|eukprot:OSX69833.1 hypothetical protein BU14_1084s0001 [Porphyra umbilicalis]
MLFSRLLTPPAPAVDGPSPRADTQAFFLTPDPLWAQAGWAAAALAAAASAALPRWLPRLSPAAAARAARAVTAAAVGAPALAPLRAAVATRIVAVASYTLRPSARGRVTLTPDGGVGIDPAALSTADDWEAAVAGVVAAVRLLYESPEVAAAAGGPLLPLLPPLSPATVLSLLPGGGGGGGGGGRRCRPRPPRCCRSAVRPPRAPPSTRTCGRLQRPRGTRSARAGWGTGAARPPLLTRSPTGGAGSMASAACGSSICPCRQQW